MCEKKYVLSFIKNRLNGKIENLATFDFMELSNDYGATTAFDPDDTKIARCIYCLLWKDKIPKLSLENLGNGKMYRGDTLNTFNTLFGSDRVSENGRTVFQNCSEKFGFDKDTDFLNEILNFKKIYTQIGNFSILPCVPNYSFNYYRGDNRGWGDYYDRFLIELEKCFLLQSTDVKAKKIFEKNSFFFEDSKIFGEKDKIEKFCNLFYLEDYLENGHPKELFKTDWNWIIQSRFRMSQSELNKKMYKKFAENYISICTEIIRHRTERIISELERIL